MSINHPPLKNTVNADPIHLIKDVNPCIQNIEGNECFFVPQLIDSSMLQTAPAECAGFSWEPIHEQPIILQEDEIDAFIQPLKNIPKNERTQLQIGILENDIDAIVTLLKSGDKPQVAEEFAFLIDLLHESGHQTELRTAFKELKAPQAKHLVLYIYQAHRINTLAKPINFNIIKQYIDFQPEDLRKPPLNKGSLLLTSPLIGSEWAWVYYSLGKDNQLKLGASLPEQRTPQMNEQVNGAFLEIVQPSTSALYENGGNSCESNNLVCTEFVSSLLKEEGVFSEQLNKMEDFQSQRSISLGWEMLMKGHHHGMNPSGANSITKLLRIKDWDTKKFVELMHVRQDILVDLYTSLLNPERASDNTPQRRELILSLVDLGLIPHQLREKSVLVWGIQNRLSQLKPDCPKLAKKLEEAGYHKEWENLNIQASDKDPFVIAANKNSSGAVLSLLKLNQRPHTPEGFASIIDLLHENKFQHDLSQLFSNLETLEDKQNVVTAYRELCLREGKPFTWDVIGQYIEITEELLSVKKTKSAPSIAAWFPNTNSTFGVAALALIGLVSFIAKKAGLLPTRTEPESQPISIQPAPSIQDVKKPALSITNTDESLSKPPQPKKEEKTFFTMLLAPLQWLGSLLLLPFRLIGSLFG